METLPRARDGPRHRGGRASRPRASWAAATGTGRTARRSRRCAARWTTSRWTAPSSSARASATRRRCSTSASRSASAGPASREVDIAVDPLEGTNLVALRPGQRDHRPGRVRARRAAARARHLHREALRRAGRGGPRRHHACRPPRTCSASPTPCTARSPTSRSSSSSGRATRRSSTRSARPARASSSSPTATCRRPSACAVTGTGVHGVMGIGGAPEGVLTAAALRCLGGEIQARFRFRNDEERAARRADGHHADRGARLSRPRTWRPARTWSSRPPA